MSNCLSIRLLSIPLVLAMLAGPVPAQVVLKPNGQNAVPLRTKSLRSSVTISGQFATTKTEMVFQNETAERVEADFIYTVPPHAVVTYFAYWYGNEKVVARVVEKERAALIYQHITTRMRDPALVEMIGKRTFRARIFPVMPNADLKVEVHLVETLASTALGALYEYPLPVNRGAAVNLEHLDIGVTIMADSSIQRVLNNYSLPLAQEPRSYRLWLSRSNFRPAQNLRIQLVRQRQPLQAALFAAASGGRDGFFALALTPSRILRRPVVRIRGVATYQLWPRRLSSLPAHQAVTLVGRYRGSGPAVVTVTGSTRGGQWTASRRVAFSGQRESNNLATKLWAARAIEVLSAHRKNREQVIALSTRFTLPSRYTSWLAVPREEMKRYQAEKLAVDCEFYKNQLVLAIRHGMRHHPEVRRMQQRYIQAARSLGLDPQSALREQLGIVVHDLADRVREAKGQGRSHARQVQGWRREMRRLQLAGAMDQAGLYESSRRVERQLNRAQQQLDEGVSRNVGLARIQVLEGRVERLSQRYSALQERLPQRGGGGGGGGFRAGDPLISVEAAPNSLQVIALLPGGQIKTLTFNPDSGRWEARFDIPTHAPQGPFVVTVIIVNPDGSRTSVTLHFHVDMTAPEGRGQALLTGDGGKTLRLELDAAADTARVSALLPWGEAAALKPSTGHTHQFLAVIPVPADWSGPTSTVTYILTDMAHNRTTVTVDLSH